MMPAGKILVSLTIICLSPLLAFTQQFKYGSALEHVDTTGFYSITISSLLSAYIKTDLSDIRISNEKKQWVPHIVQSSQQPYSLKLNAYQDNPLPVFAQKDSNKCSYIEVRQGKSYHFDKIAISISGSKFYSRDVQVCFPDYRKNHLAKPGTVMGNFKLKPALPAIFELPRTNTALFFIVIKNADNPPLKIEKVLTQQQSFSLVTYLEQGKKYNLLLGDSLATFADYDLQAFKDSITTPYPLKYGNIYILKKNTLKNTTANKSQWIWISIIFAGVVLSFLTYRLTGDINKTKK